MIAENLYWRRRRDFLRFYVNKPVKSTQISTIFLRFYVKKPVKSTQISICRDQFVSCRRAQSARWRGKKIVLPLLDFSRRGDCPSCPPPPESATPGHSPSLEANRPLWPTANKEMFDSASDWTAVVLLTSRMGPPVPLRAPEAHIEL